MVRSRAAYPFDRGAAAAGERVCQGLSGALRIQILRRRKCSRSGAHAQAHLRRDAIDFLGMAAFGEPKAQLRSEEHTSELQSLMRISYAVFCLKKKIKIRHKNK